MATLDDIVSAAAKVFRTKGYHAATVRDIADEVGILKGSLYHHFDSKEELLYLVVKEPIAQMYRTISEIAAADGTGTEKLRRGGWGPLPTPHPPPPPPPPSPPPRPPGG